LRCPEARCFALGLGLHLVPRRQGLTLHVHRLTCLALPPEGSVVASPGGPGRRARRRPRSGQERAFDAWAGPCALGRVAACFILTSTLKRFLLTERLRCGDDGRVALQSVSSCGVPQSPATLSRVCHDRPRRTDLDAISHRSHRNLTSRSRQDLAALDHDLLEHRRCGSLAALYTPVEAGAES